VSNLHKKAGKEDYSGNVHFVYHSHANNINSKKVASKDVTLSYDI